MANPNARLITGAIARLAKQVPMILPPRRTGANRTAAASRNNLRRIIFEIHK
jgi:hypothetical protein